MTDLHKAAEAVAKDMERLDGWLKLRGGIGLTPQEVQHVAALREALAKPAVPPYVVAKDSYDKVDRFLRNNLYDEDYAEYSNALDDVLFAAAPQPKDKP